MQSPLPDRLSRALDHAVVLGFVYGAALASLFWLAFMLAPGGAK